MAKTNFVVTPGAGKITSASPFEIFRSQFRGGLQIGTQPVHQQ
jgi:hypothetical protein